MTKEKAVWVTHIIILEMCDERRQLKTSKGSEEGAQKYKEIHNKIKIEMEKTKQEWRED